MSSRDQDWAELRRTLQQIAVNQGRELELLRAHHAQASQLAGRIERILTRQIWLLILGLLLASLSGRSLDILVKLLGVP